MYIYDIFSKYLPFNKRIVLCAFFFFCFYFVKGCGTFKVFSHSVVLVLYKQLHMSPFHSECGRHRDMEVTFLSHYQTPIPAASWLLSFPSELLSVL